MLGKTLGIEGTTSYNHGQNAGGGNTHQELILPLPVGNALAVRHAGEGHTVVERNPGWEEPEEHRVHKFPEAE